MTVGVHSVIVTRNSWGASRTTNSYMTSNVTGWRAQPFDPDITWASDGWLVMPRGGTVSRSDTDANPVPRIAGDSVTYRVTVRVIQPIAGDVRVGLFLGKTIPDVWRGPFWAGTATADQFLGPVVPLAAGTWIVSARFNVPATFRPELIYVGPFVNTAQRPDTSQGPTRVDSLEMFAVPTSEVADLSCYADDVTIKHGRDGPSGQPNASTATVNLSADVTDAPMPTPEVGSVLEVATSVPGYGVFPRFFGKVTDTSVGWDDAGEDSPDMPVMQVVAASTLGELGRRIIGDVPYPQETDGLRVKRIIEAAGYTLGPLIADEGIAQILARDIDAQPAGDVARSVAESAAGILWQTRDGQIGYAGSEWRRGNVWALTLDSCDLLITPVWQRSTEGLVNGQTIVYGVEPGGGGERPFVSSLNTASRSKYGRYETTLTTDLALLADAQARATLATTRGGDPVWVMSALPIETDGLDVPRYAALLGLEMHSLVQLTGLPVIGTAPTNSVLWVEGWSETLRYAEHDMTLAVSGYCRTAPAPRWDDPPTTMTWDNVGTMTWDAGCLGPLPAVGRWMDVSTTIRWDDVDAALTWDTWV